MKSPVWSLPVEVALGRDEDERPLVLEEALVLERAAIVVALSPSSRR